MMREILFRGLTRKKGEKVRMDGSPVDGNWVYGGIFPGTGDYSIIYGAATENFSGLDLEKHVVYSETVGQWTGLIDRNGIKVFEGDILALTDMTNTTYYCVVQWGGFNCSCCDGVFGWYLDEDGDIRDFANENLQGERYTVVGNIHDNPELLKKEGSRHE